MNDFKLIAIRPKKGCSKNILKNLSEDYYYFFDNSYEPSSNNFIQKKSTSTGQVPDNFFYHKEVNNATSLKTVNIQAIVGKNGEGKSSLVDFALRILNNFHYLILPPEFNKLLYIQGLFGELYFKAGENLYRISIDHSGDKRATFYEKGENTEKCIKTLTESWDTWEHKEVLFFSLGINYSLYSWNTDHYKEEVAFPNHQYIGESSYGLPSNWLKQLLNKNDGYLTPISLHPHRDKGIIDVNNEEFLTRQRLLSLCLNSDLGFDKIREDQKFTDFLIESKEMDYTLEILGVISHIIDPNTATNIYSFVANNLLYELQSMDNKDLLNIATFFDGITPIFIKNIYKINEHLHDPNKNNDDNHKQSKIYRERISEVLKNRGFSPEDLKKIMSTIDLFETNFPYINERILSLAIYQTEIYRIWKEKIFETIVDDIDNNILEECLDYLTYKTIAINTLYPKYMDKIVLDGNWLFSKNVFENYENLISICEQYISSLLQDRSHITLKLFQVLNYVCNINSIKSYKKFKKLFELNNIKKTGNYVIKIDKYSEVIQELLGIYISENNSDLTIERFYLEFLPPPIFKTDLIIENEKGQNITFNGLSSGERQLISVTSSIIYHLKNIDSIEVGSLDHYELFSYNYVNIVLDEIELYFHPEYQRQFISRLLYLLEKVNFVKIRAINIITITHSPFILSDIPKNNVMFLEKGKQVYPMSENTFGANVHTLLQHGFFLNNVPIGEFAKNKINELFDIIHNNDINQKEYSELEKRILLISEPFLKSQLLKLYHERRPYTMHKNDEFYQFLIDRINFLEKKIDDINK